MKLNLKFLYFLTLAALAMYVTTGPVSASVAGPPPAPEIFNTGIGNTTSTGDPSTLLLWNSVAWDQQYGYTLNLSADAQCILLSGPDPSCAGSLGFYFSVFSPGNIAISLVGTSSDPLATGTATFDGVTEPWSIDGDGNVIMAPFSVGVSGADGVYFGQFNITNLAPNQYLELPVVVESDPPAPEPGSALLLGSGIALVEFLRRKIRR